MQIKPVTKANKPEYPTADANYFAYLLVFGKSSTPTELWQTDGQALLLTFNSYAV